MAFGEILLFFLFFYFFLFILFCLRDTAGGPKRARWLHLAHSGSQSQRAIWFILPAHGTSHIIIIIIAYLSRKTQKIITKSPSHSNKITLQADNHLPPNLWQNYPVNKTYDVYPQCLSTPTSQREMEIPKYGDQRTRNFGRGGGWTVNFNSFQMESTIEKAVVQKSFLTY